MSDSANGGDAEAARPQKVRTTPLPRIKMVAVGATLLVESICGSMLLPFVGLYVAHLKHISVEDAGYYSGILVGLFMLGQVLSSKMWGWLSDVYGRRVPLIVGLFAGAWTMLFFGMAPNIYVCCLMRFIHGILNGNVLIAKIIISDITDNTNAALGFSMVGLLWCVGSVIGPAVGGFLYDPLENSMLRWMHVKPNSFLARNPAFLPSLFVFLYTMTSFALCAILLPETNVHRTKSLRNVPVIGWIINTVRPKAVVIETAAAEEHSAPAPPKAPAMTYAKAFKDPVIRAITILYMCISSTDMTFGEIFPLWAIASPSVGGLGMFSDAVGTLMLCFAIPTFVSNLMFPKVYKLLNNGSKVFRLSVAVFIATVILIPFGANLSQRGAFWYVLLMGSIKNSSGSSAYNIVHLHTAKAAPPGTVGSVYGISQSMAGVVRCIVPFVVAPIFAWSISGGHVFPFDHYFVFFVSVIPLFYSIFLTLRHRIDRTEEELAAWTTAEERERDGPSSSEAGDDDVAQRSVAEDYRSLATSFAMSQADNVFSQLPAMEAENAQQGLVREWVRHTAPRAAGKRLEPSVTALQHEDFRLVSQLEEEEDRDTNGIEERA